MNTLRTMLIAVFALISGAFIAPQANAESEEWQIAVGVGLIAQEQIWVDADTLVSAVPLVSIDYGRWHFFNNGIVSYDVINTNDFQVSFGVDYLEEGFGASVFAKESSSNNIVFDGYETPDGEVVGNMRAVWHAFSMNVQQDLSNTSNGTVVELGFNQPLYKYAETFSVSANVSAKWMSENYAQHIYGIEGGQIDSTKGRTAYEVEASINYSISMTADYKLTDEWVFSATASYSKVDDEIVASPLVEDDTFSQLFVGMFYSF